jgi:hypothetical protein
MWLESDVQSLKEPEELREEAQNTEARIERARENQKKERNEKRPCSERIVIKRTLELNGRSKHTKE